MFRKLKILLIFVPVSLGLSFFLDGSLLTFASTALAIIPLATIMSELTDRLRVDLGSSWGGLINVTFGNATELIISVFAIYDGLLNVVKANITGSIIMNLLLVLGLSFFLGGLKYRRQQFDKLLAITNSAMLMLAVVGMLVPAIFYFGSENVRTIVLRRLSIGVGIVLFITYLASLYFTLIYHEKEKKHWTVDKNKSNTRQYPNNNKMKNEKEEDHPKKDSNKKCTNIEDNRISLYSAFFISRKVSQKDKKSRGKKTILKNAVFLLLTTLIIAVEANILVSSISVIQENLNISVVFIGVIILPIISNVAENVTAVRMARENKIDLSITIAIGSSIQVALFLVPLLIFFSNFTPNPMNFLFNILEISTIGLSVLAINIVYLQGKSNWFEGLQLIAAYLIIAIAFFFA
ncbi:MAG: calcium:proton antiporter [Halanaerobiaceae bacterium]